ncbi:DUF4062 domain-containing protein [bacterium]|nr:DUF4062 domain-containing protein [bacterium]
MPKIKTVISIFVASPSDTKDQRNLVENVVDELNIALVNQPIQLEILKWETHSRTSLGESAQDVINQSIGNDYDIFIGFLNQKFGNPTLKADSGTLEEFNIALERRRQTGTSPEIMFYFSNAPVPLMEINLEDAKKIQDFKERLSKEGALYTLFSNDVQLASKLRLDLGAYIQKYQNPSLASIPQKSEDATLHVDDEYGYLDLVEDATDDFQYATLSMNRINDAIFAVSEKINQRTIEINSSRETGTLSTQRMRQIINKTVEHMDDFSKIMETETEQFSRLFSKGINSFSKAAVLSKDFSNSQKNIHNDYKALISLLQKMKLNYNDMNTFKIAVEALPRITTNLNLAKKRVSACLTNFQRALEENTQLADQAASSLQKLVNGQVE